MHARFTLGVGLTVALATSSALADVPLRRVVPAGGGLEAIEVRVDAAAGVVRVAKGGKEREIPIGIERSRIDAAASTIDVVPIAEGRSVAHVRVPDAQRKDLAFEVVIAGQGDEPIFKGLTGYTRGEEGDRSGQRVLVKDRDGQSKFVIIAETREDTRICGQSETVLGAKGLNPATMKLVGATLPRLDKPTRDGAERVVAQPRASTTAPLARILVATGGSSPNAPALTDGKVETTWSEARTGDGHGEFVTMRAPSELPIHSLVITVAPSMPKAGGAAPRTFYVTTDEKAFLVTMPEDAWLKPGQTYDVPFPAPVRTGCVAIVLDGAYAHDTTPEVTIAEVEAVTTFDADGAKLADVAKALGTPRGEEAAALLRRATAEGLAAVVTEYPTLDARGRALAVDVASSAGACDGPAAELLTRALADRETEVRRRALGRIERCGKAAGPALVLAVSGEDEPRRLAAAPLLATVAPSLAIEPLAEQMGKGKPETRRAIRGAFARASVGATRDKLLALLARREMPLVARLDLLRAMGAKLAELRPEADVALADLLRASPDMTTRYLLTQPLAHLARAREATSGELSRLAELARRDPEWPVRAHAVELSAAIAPLAPIVIAAASDPEPRVREAALRGIASSRLGAGVPAAAEAMTRDEWTFVRIAAAEALGAAPQGPAATSALVAGLEDKSPKVRSTAIAALGRQRAIAQAPRVRERLDDTKEDPEVRALAARTLGAMCVQSASDRLTKLALLSRSPVDEADERIGVAAIDALGALHPADLAARLAPLRVKGIPMPVRRAVERAISEPSPCR
jgi:HEAT repeat protein